MIIRFILPFLIIFLSFSANSQVPNNVNGPLRQFGTITPGDGVVWQANNLVKDSGAPGGGSVGSGNAGNVAFYQSTGNVVVGTSTINIFHGNVGIGTATPIYPFQVNNGTTILMDVQNTGELDTSGPIFSLANINGTNFLAANNGYYSWAGGVNTYITSPSSAVVQLGQADSSTAVNQTLRVQGIAAGNSNVNGGNLTISSGTSTGNGVSQIQFQAYPGTVGIGTAQNSPTTAMTILGSGNVGIGTAAPISLFEVFGGNPEVVNSSPQLLLQGTEAGNHLISLSESFGGTFFKDTTGNLALHFRNSANTDALFAQTSPTAVGVGTTVFGANTVLAVNGGVAFGTYGGNGSSPPSGGMIVSGGVGIGTTSLRNSSTLDIQGGININSTINAPGLATSSSAQTGALCWTTGTGNFTVDTTTTCLLSSRRFKKDIEPMGDALAEIAAMHPITFVYKDPAMTQDRLSGLIAEDLYPIDKTLVELDSEGQPYKIRYEGLTAVNTKAIQQITQQVAHLGNNVFEGTHKCHFLGIELHQLCAD